MEPHSRLLAPVVACFWTIAVCLGGADRAGAAGERSTIVTGTDIELQNHNYESAEASGDAIQDIIDALFEDWRTVSGTWEDVPDSAVDSQISGTDDENSTGPSLARDRATGQLFCAWSQKDAADGKNEIYVKSYDPSVRNSAWMALANGGSPDGRITDTGRDSVAPKLLVQTSPTKRLWVIWQEGRSGDVLEQVMNVDLESGFYSVLDAIKSIEYEGTYIYARCYDLETSQWDATLDYSDSTTGKTVSGNDEHSMASRPDAVLTADGHPFVVWDYIRFSPEGGAGLTSVTKIMDAPKNNLGAIFGAVNTGGAWGTLAGVALDYENASTNALTATGQWDISVSPQVTLCADGRPAIAWVHTEVDAAGRGAGDYRGYSQVHALKYDGATWGDTQFAGVGASDGGVSQWRTDEGVGICTQPAIAALPSGEVAIVFTRTGPELSELTGVKVVQVTGKVWDPMMAQWTDYYADADNPGWRDLSQSIFDVATGADLAVTGNGEAVVAWTDAGLNVFALRWDKQRQTWDTFGQSWWLPSDVNEEAGLQSGVDVICDLGQPLVAWTSAPLSGTLKSTVDALATTSDITVELLDDIQAELESAVFDIRVRRFSADGQVDLTDIDEDGLPDAWETATFGSLDQDPWMDYDKDYLSNYEEWEMGLDATDMDTDQDGYYDKAETMIPWGDPAASTTPGGGVVISGTIHDSATGNPVAFAHVLALMPGTDMAAPPLASTDTGSDANQDPGTYELEVPVGVQVVVVAGGPYLLPSFHGGSATPVGATILGANEPAALSGIDISLEPARPVFGILTDAADGVPLPNIPVDALATADGAFLSRSRSGSDGHYTLWGPLDTEFVVRAGGAWYAEKYHDDVSSIEDATPYTLTGADVLPGIDFALDFSAAIGDHVFDVDIEQTYAYGRLHQELHYRFEFGMRTDGLVARVEFDTPNGSTFVISEDSFTADGDFSAYHWYNQEEQAHSWGHSGAFAAVDGLAVYGDGDYIVRVTYRDGRTQETTIPFSTGGARAAIAQPMAEPVFTGPAHDALVTSPVTITWDVYVEGVAEGVYLDLDDDEVETLPIDGESYGPLELGLGRHTAELFFVNGVQGENSDQIGYECYKDSTAVLDFVVVASEDLTLELSVGWNLISIPRVTTMSVEQIFVDDAEQAINVGPLYSWNPSAERGAVYEGIEGTDVPVALVGYWLYSVAGGVTQPITGVASGGLVDLVTGWNLVGPATAVLIPEVPEIWPDVWGWDAQNGLYHRVAEGEELLPGKGYWLNALEDVAALELAEELDLLFSADNWDGGEAHFVEDVATLQSAINEIAADEDAQNALDSALDGLRGGTARGAVRGPLAGFRAVNWNAQDRRIELSYSHAQVSGNVYITREGTVLNRYYLVDFQDDFSFFGIDIDGKVELQRHGVGLREFDVRIHRGRLAFGRHSTGRRAFLVLAGVVVVKNDVFEVDIPRHESNSGLTGGVLGERFFQLFTSDQFSEALVFPRDWSDCPFPTSGPLGVSGRLKNIMLQFMDDRQLSDRLTDNGLGGTVADAFRHLTFEFWRDIDVSARYRFSGDSTPVIEGLVAEAIHVAVNSNLNECPDAIGRDWMGRVDEVLFGIPGLQDWLRRSARNKAEQFLLERADGDGCWVVPADHVGERVKDRLADVIDWDTRLASPFGRETGTIDASSRESRVRR